MKNRRVASALLLAIVCPAVFAGGVWNQWRGPDRDGRGEIFGTLEAWPEKPAEVWRIDAGSGHASPVTDGERVYLFSRVEEHEVAAAFALADGAELWSQRYPVRFRARMGGGHHGAGPKSTPIVAGGRLVTFGITGVLSSWDAETGEKQWQIDFAAGQKDEPFPRWGNSFSPLIHEGRVIAHVAGDDGGVLLALDATTGEEVWRREGSAPSYASPVVAELGGLDQLVALTADGLLALSPEGEELWQFDYPMTYMRQNVPTPMVTGGLVVIAGEKRPMTALRPKQAEGGWRVETVWSREDLPAEMSTAVADRGRFCGLTYLKKGQAFCIDGNGETVWVGPPRFGDYATIVAVPQALFYLLPDATLVVLESSGSAYRELARYALADSEIWAHPAVLEAGLLVKSRDRLARWSFSE